MLLFILLLETWTSDTQSRCSVYFGATWQNSFVFLFFCLTPKCRCLSRFCLLSWFLGFCIFLSVNASTPFKLLCPERMISWSNLPSPQKKQKPKTKPKHLNFHFQLIVAYLYLDVLLQLKPRACSWTQCFLFPTQLVLFFFSPQI